MCFEVHQAVYQDPCCIWSEEGVGAGGNLPFPPMAFVIIFVIDIFTTYWHFKHLEILCLWAFIKILDVCG